MALTAPIRLDVFPNGNPQPEQRAEVRAAHEGLKGRDPRELTPADFASIGHARRSFLSIIRQNCVECQGGGPGEVRNCACTACVFWPYRMGSNPFVSEARREQGRRLAQNRATALENDPL